MPTPADAPTLDATLLEADLNAVEIMLCAMAEEAYVKGHGAAVVRCTERADRLRGLASSLPALLEASRREEQLKAAAELCADDQTWFFRTEAFVGPSNPNDPFELHVNCNDYFAPAADSEEVPLNEAPTLWKLYREGGHNAVMGWVAARRGVPNKRWRAARSSGETTHAQERNHG